MMQAQDENSDSIRTDIGISNIASMKKKKCCVAFLSGKGLNQRKEYVLEALKELVKKKDDW